jgi:hypothetical protein
LMRFFAGIIVWATIFLVYIVILGFTAWMYWKGIGKF